LSKRQQDDIRNCAGARMTRAMSTEMAEQERAGRQAPCHRMRRPQEHPGASLEKGLEDVLREPYQGSP
jgi:hypothetical protein